LQEQEDLSIEQQMAEQYKAFATAGNMAGKHKALSKLEDAVQTRRYSSKWRSNTRPLQNTEREEEVKLVKRECQGDRAVRVLAQELRGQSV